MRAQRNFITYFPRRKSSKRRGLNLELMRINHDVLTPVAKQIQSRGRRSMLDIVQVHHPDENRCVDPYYHRSSYIVSRLSSSSDSETPV